MHPAEGLKHGTHRLFERERSRGGHGPNDALFDKNRRNTAGSSWRAGAKVILISDAQDWDAEIRRPGGRFEMPAAVAGFALAPILFYAHPCPTAWPIILPFGQGTESTSHANPRTKSVDRRMNLTPYMGKLNVLADPLPSTNCTALTTVDRPIWAWTNPQYQRSDQSLAGRAALG